jgi:hypothetical protein
MKKILAYIPLWSLYRFAQLINYINNIIEKTFKFIDLLNPIDNFMMYIYYIIMLQCIQLQEWSKLTKPYNL